MKISINKEQGKQIMPEVKTFPVPFSIDETKENIIITTNTPANHPNEEIINQAFKLHSQGNILEAAKYYQNFIKQGLNDPRVFSNYGIILMDVGKSQEAELSYRRAIQLQPDLAEAHYNLANTLRANGKLKEAELFQRKTIEINPNFAEAYLNLGSTLRALGKLKEAELSFRKTIQLKPDLAEAHYNLANTLRDNGKLKEAELSQRKAIKINPGYADAHNNLGIILMDIGKTEEAFDSYLKAIEINGKKSPNYAFIVQFLKDSNPSKLNQITLKNILFILLKRDDIPHKELFLAFNALYKKELISYQDKLKSTFFRKELFQILIIDQLLIQALTKITFRSYKWEILLTKTRRMLSTMIAREKITANDSELQFIIALAGQCFLNEYVYSMTEQENITVNTIINSCRDGDINETNIAILACYIPLYKLLDRIPSLKSIYASKDNFKELIKLQVSDPLNEFELSRKIKKIGLINDNISQKVKSQYEKNPYPRWKYADPSKEVKISYIETINAEISPNSINSNLESHQLKILIAGCGTGNQILQAQRYNNAEITGIDLSSSSLAYAQRKVNQLGINNVELFQMDILEVKLLEKYYDIIECGGVLHHMADPKKGLNALLSVLQKEGFLKLGLYSELARTDIVKAREYIATNNLLPNDEGIKAFREDVFSNKVQKIKDLKNLGDFYTTSECRDLCFHAQEHRFTINQLEETLYSNDLQFLGFLLPQPIKSLYKNYFPEDQTQTNLQNWARFEEKNPYTFIAMYQFWVSKKNIYHFKE